MQTRVHSRVLLLLAALLASGAVALVAVAEESKSTPLAKELGPRLKALPYVIVIAPNGKRTEIVGLAPAKLLAALGGSR